ncbi:alpha-1,2-fucosyltransferase [Arsenicibacter rosenii]|uniref:Alpha-1,2-fucosyltransferase n=1 Tax=Arsenicibacter rosenii TaxID=1750698 RepID=A0A1S2VPG0_9BACT|nr:alpha-1,2-fucosyltransferase [Arsenicibacter rosenii]OIN60280.1 hypothetical protein BLX24_05465 [Arsenicibacter rosenii]
MVITELNGGFGNQLFQYAIGKQLAEQHQTQLLLDTTWLSSQDKAAIFPFEAIDPNVAIAPAKLVGPFSITANRWQRMARRIINTYRPHRITFIRERYPYQVSLPQPQLPCYLTGYWQHPGYFAGIADRLQSSLQFLLRAYVPAGYHTGKQTVGLHIRRGDYLLNRRYQTLPATYYIHALQLLEKHTGPFQVNVFSDDPAWCRQHVLLPESAWFCEPAPALVHLAQMSGCRHFIIPNSTFSWWAAWIGRQPDTCIIAPRYWLCLNNQLVEAPGLTQYTLTIP